MIRDCVVNCSASDLLSSLAKGSVGAVITEPPLLVQSGRGGSEFSDPWTHAQDLDHALNETRPIVHDSYRVLRAGGALCIIGNGIVPNVWDLLARQVGFDWMAEVIVLWNSNRPRTLNLGSLFTRVNWYSKPGAKHTSNLVEQRSVSSNVLVCQEVPHQSRRHPAELPVALTNFLVSLLTRGASLRTSNQPDTIVDPFCGSGSTLVSAAICDRHWIGSDLSPEYCSVARQRVDHFEIEEVEPAHLWTSGRLQEV